MVKFFFLFALAVQAFALSSLELAKNLIPNVKNSQLELLFAKDDYKDNNANLDIEKIVRILKTNSLLNLTLNNPRTLHLNFKAKADGVLFFKILNEALNDAGYVYFIPTSLTLQEGFIDYSIQVESKYVLDPGVFYKLLKANFVFIENIKYLGDYNYEYTLNFDQAKLKTNTQISLNTTQDLQKPFKDYTLELKGASSLIIQANEADTWFPKILFLDKNLNLIKSIKSQSKNNHFSALIPSGAEYVIISDTFNLDNIKRGLKITLKK